MSEQASELPTVDLIERAFYWIKPSYGPGVGDWVVAKWEVGSFWTVKGSEVTPRTISGPIPRPPEPTEASDARSLTTNQEGE